MKKCFWEDSTRISTCNHEEICRRYAYIRLHTRLPHDPRYKNGKVQQEDEKNEVIDEETDQKLLGNLNLSEEKTWNEK